VSKYIVVVYCVCVYKCVARVGLCVCVYASVYALLHVTVVVLAFAACSCVWFVPAAAKSAMSSAVNRVCNVENVDSETTRFEWVVGSLSKYQLGDKVTSTNVAAGELFCHRLFLMILLVHVKKLSKCVGSGREFLCARGRKGGEEGGRRERVGAGWEERGNGESERDGLRVGFWVSRCVRVYVYKRACVRK